MSIYHLRHKHSALGILEQVDMALSTQSTIIKAYNGSGVSHRTIALLADC
jgi:hypothetical protein